MKITHVKEITMEADEIRLKLLNENETEIYFMAKGKQLIIHDYEYENQKTEDKIVEIIDII